MENDQNSITDRAISYLQVALPNGILYSQGAMWPFPKNGQKNFLAYFTNGTVYGISVKNAVNILGWEAVKEMVMLGSYPIDKEIFKQFLAANTKGLY